MLQLEFSQPAETTGRPVFEDSYARKEQDFADLRSVRDGVGADIIALQEISSLAALAKVFPVEHFVLCISGQLDADLNGLGHDEALAAQTTPACAISQTDPLPDVPPTVSPKQYTAFAIRRSPDIQLVASSDVKGFGVVHDPDQRVTRWGPEITVRSGGQSFRLLSIHLKTGCFQGAIAATSTNANCQTLAKALPAFREWVATAGSSGFPFLVLGDFNRRLDGERHRAPNRPVGYNGGCGR